jgi:hypothetical protein
MCDSPDQIACPRPLSWGLHLFPSALGCTRIMIFFAQYYCKTRWNSTGKLTICYISFRTVTFPSFLPYSLPFLHVNRMMLWGRSSTPFPTNNTNKYSLVNRLLFYNILHFTHPHQNIIVTHRIHTIHWNIRPLAHSWTKATEWLFFYLHSGGWKQGPLDTAAT